MNNLSQSERFIKVSFVCGPRPWAVGEMVGKAIARTFGSYDSPERAIACAECLCRQWGAEIVLPEQLLPLAEEVMLPVTDDSLDFDRFLYDVRQGRTVMLAGTVCYDERELQNEMFEQGRGD